MLEINAHLSITEHVETTAKWRRLENPYYLQIAKLEEARQSVLFTNCT